MSAAPQRTNPVRAKAPLLQAYATLVYAFLYLPIVVLIVYSFNGGGVGGFPPRNWTLDCGTRCSIACWWLLPR